MIELKGGENNSILPKKLLELLGKYNHQGCILASFNEHYVAELRRLSNIKEKYLDFKLGMIVVSSNTNNLIAMSKIYQLNVIINEYDIVTKEMIQQLHQNNIQIFCYTINSSYVCHKLVNMGCDGIITNYANCDQYIANI